MSNDANPRRGLGRTSVITFLAISAVSVTGALALGANLGLLDSTSDDGLGELAAAGDLAVPTPQVIDVYVDDTVAATTTSLPATSPDAGLQTFAVDAAGTVTLATTGGLRVEELALEQGWSWELLPAAPGTVALRLTNGIRTLEFTASVAPDGTVAASVSEPIVEPAPVVAAPPANTSSARNDDDDEHEDEEHEIEYEGGEDDD